MFLINLLVIFGALLQATDAFLDKRVLDDPAQEYLSSVCLPLFTNMSITGGFAGYEDAIAKMADSPFPCEKVLYMQRVCSANGTTVFDFLAEQQCFCNGAYWDLVEGCDNCYYAHGFQETNVEDAASTRSSLSAAECTPSPPYQPYTNLLVKVNITSLRLAPPLTLGVDKFPNMTEVSNYFPATRSLTAGQITGDATGRLATFTNTLNLGYTPTNIPSTSGIFSSLSKASSTSTSSATSSNAATTTSSGNAGATGGVEVAALVVAAGMGVMAFL